MDPILRVPEQQMRITDHPRISEIDRPTNSCRHARTKLSHGNRYELNHYTCDYPSHTIPPVPAYLMV